MGDDWSFNLRAFNPPSDDDEDSDDDKDASHNLLSNDAESLHQIDLSTRPDDAQYKPDPWKIAKLNAASRPKCPMSVPSTNLPAAVKSKPKGPIIDAFQKQTKKLQPKPAQDSTDPANFNTKSLPQIRPCDPSVAIRNNCSQTLRSPKVLTVNPLAPPVITSLGAWPEMHPLTLDNEAAPSSRYTDQENAHTVMSLSPYSPRTASSIRTPSMTYSPRPNNIDLVARDCVPANRDLLYHTVKNQANSRTTDRPTFSCDLSRSRVPNNPGMFLDRTLVSVPSNVPRQPPQSTAHDTIDRLFERAANQFTNRQVMTSPAPSSPRREHIYNRETQSSPVPSRQVNLPRKTKPFLSFVQTRIPNHSHSSIVESPQVRTSSQTHKRKMISKPPSPLRPPPYLRSPSTSPIRSNNSRLPYDLPKVPSQDSEWTTLPPKKKHIAKKGVKESGKFRLPRGLVSGRRIDASSNIGKNRPRVVTYLPPPLKKTFDGEQIVSEDNHEERLTDGHGDCLTKGIGGLPSPPPSDDQPSSSKETPVVQFDTRSVARRYATVRQSIRRRKKQSGQLWEILGLESCGVVFRDPPLNVTQTNTKHEIAIVSWPS